jgi:hypothetical protein
LRAQFSPAPVFHNFLRKIKCFSSSHQNPRVITFSRQKWNRPIWSVSMAKSPTG